jgi:hypothetical protein
MLSVAALLALQATSLSSARQRLLAEGIPLPLLQALDGTDIIRATTNPRWPYLPEGREICLVCFGDAAGVQSLLRSSLRKNRGWKVGRASHVNGPVFESRRAWIGASSGHMGSDAPLLFKNVFQVDPEMALNDYLRALDQGTIQATRTPKGLFDVRIIVKQAPIRV